MSKFAVYDFSETMGRLESEHGIALSDVDRVIAAHGEHGDYAEWDGGFLLAMKDGSAGYVTGWCDTTGWGCQDGIEWTPATDTRPEKVNAKADWLTDPEDLNRYVRGEIGPFDD